MINLNALSRKYFEYLDANGIAFKSLPFRQRQEFVAVTNARDYKVGRPVDDKLRAELSIHANQHHHNPVFAMQVLTDKLLDTPWFGQHIDTLVEQDTLGIDPEKHVHPLYERTTWRELGIILEAQGFQNKLDIPNKEEQYSIWYDASLGMLVAAESNEGYVGRLNMFFELSFGKKLVDLSHCEDLAFNLLIAGRSLPIDEDVTGYMMQCSSPRILEYRAMLKVSPFETNIEWKRKSSGVLFLNPSGTEIGKGTLATLEALPEKVQTAIGFPYG
jgi:hypothetical protein